MVPKKKRTRGTFELSVESHFSAAHHLRRYRGRCAERHGHNWLVTVMVRGRRLDTSGMLLDFGILKERVRASVDALDHTDLNALAGFSRENPTSENIARWLFGRLSRELNCPKYRVQRVTVSETPGTTCAYWE